MAGCDTPILPGRSSDGKTRVDTAAARELKHRTNKRKQYMFTTLAAARTNIGKNEQMYTAYVYYLVVPERRGAGYKLTQSRVASSMAAWMLRLAQASPMRHSMKRPCALVSMVCGAASAMARRSASPRLRESGLSAR